MNDVTPVRDDKFSRYRAAKRAKGLREVRMWVPDVSSPEFKAQAKREATILRGAPEELEALDFIEATMAEDSELYR